MLNRLMYNLFDWEEPESFGVRTYLRVFEFFVAAYSLIYAWSWGFYIRKIHDVVLPLGLANYINDEIFFGNDLALWLAGLLTLLTTAGFLGRGRRFRWAYLAAFPLLHLLYVTRFSLGEIPHSSNLVGFGLLGLGLGFVFFKDRLKALSFGYGLMIFFIGLGYTTAGISKLVASGVTWVDGHHLWLWIAEKSTDVLSGYGSFELNALQEVALSSRTAATAILGVGLLTELSAFLLWFKRLRPWITLAVIGMHIGIYYSMNIFFLSYMIGLVIVGFPWHLLLNRLKSRGNPAPKP
ncbi:MAG: hypothetical protein U5K31_11865 [Balneolaceae bacterium]|nr:hypothetical protein [Balneolaceae bacterium]